MQGEDARQADAPLLAAGYFVRIEIEVGVGQPDRFQDAANARSRAAASRSVWITSGSCRELPIFQRGSSDAPGS
jgi:hypothetical protein